MPANAYLFESKNHAVYMYVLFTLLLSSFIFFFLASPSQVIFLAKEDSVFEWGTCFGYLTTAVLLLLTWHQNKNIFLLLLALVLLFGGFEEISWGQRLFGFETPEAIKEKNVQGEFTVHNLKYFSKKQFAEQKEGEVGKLFDIDVAFKLFTICFGILLPLATYHIKPISKLVQRFKVPVPPVSIGIFFFLSWIILKITFASVSPDMDHETIKHLGWATTEMSEFNSGLVLVAIAWYFYKHRKQPIMGKDFKQYFIAQ